MSSSSLAIHNLPLTAAIPTIQFYQAKSKEKQSKVQFQLELSLAQFKTFFSFRNTLPNDLTQMKIIRSLANPTCKVAVITDFEHLRQQPTLADYRKYNLIWNVKPEYLDLAKNWLRNFRLKKKCMMILNWVCHANVSDYRNYTLIWHTYLEIHELTQTWLPNYGPNQNAHIVDLEHLRQQASLATYRN